MAIYGFIDTIERAVRGGYPAEALNFNGKYFEDEIKGYQTLNVTGREAIESEIDIIETKARNGARYRSSRYKSRTITVRYQILAETALEMMAKFNKLNHLLDVEEARLIFHDEPDKFFIGTRQRLSPPKEGELFTKGEIEFLCSDPYKYSVKEYKVEARDGVISTMYRGTVPNPPVFKVRPKTDLAFLEILMDEGRIVAGMESALNGDLTGNARDVFTSIDDLTTVSTRRPCIPENIGIFFWDYSDDPDRFKQTEVIDGEPWLVPLVDPCNTIRTIDSEGSINDETLIVAFDQFEEEFEWDEETLSWHSTVTENEEPINTGYDITTLDEDEYYASQYQLHGTGADYALTDVTKPNFSLEWESRLYAESLLQRGAQAYTVYGTETTTDENDNEVSTDVQMLGVAVKKVAVGTNRLEVDVYVDGEQVDTIIMSSLPTNPVFGRSSLPCSVSRFGTTYTLRLGNESYTYAAGRTNVPTCVSVYALDYTGAPRTTRNAIRYVKYTEHTATTAKGVKNLIRNGSELVIDCAGADIRLNGISEPSLGDIANEWDAMELVPGMNAVAVSAVSTEAPEVTMTYREAYL